MNWTKRRDYFRGLIETGPCIFPASVFDPISARIAESIGFETGILAGSVASLSVLGAPDLILLTLSELTEQVRRISRASALPMLVDADHGFGNALNVARTVQELEAAGVTALMIEDTQLPRPYAASSGSPVVSIDEAVGKIRAALAGRSDPSLFIAARINVGAMPIDDALRRLEAYQKTKPDAIFLAGVKKQSELEALSAQARIPLMLGRVTPELSDPAYLAGQNVRLALQGHAPISAAYKAVYDSLMALRNDKSTCANTDAPMADLMNALMRKEEYQAAIADFLEPHCDSSD